MDEASKVRSEPVHRLKLRENSVRRILDGTMRFQIRENDRDFQPGDIIEFKVVDWAGGEYERDEFCPGCWRDSRNRQYDYPFIYCDEDEKERIEQMRFRVGFVGVSPGLQAGYVAFSICPIQVENGVSSD